MDICVGILTSREYRKPMMLAAMLGVFIGCDWQICLFFLLTPVKVLIFLLSSRWKWENNFVIYFEGEWINVTVAADSRHAPSYHILLPD